MTKDAVKIVVEIDRDLYDKVREASKHITADGWRGSAAASRQERNILAAFQRLATAALLETDPPLVLTVGGWATVGGGELVKLVAEDDGIWWIKFGTSARGFLHAERLTPADPPEDDQITMFGGGQ